MSDSDSVRSTHLQPPQDTLERLSRHSSNALTIGRERTLGQFSDIVRTISNQDVETRYRTAEADNRIRASYINNNNDANDDDASPRNSLHAADGKKIISWEPNDKENPNNWSDVCITSW